MQTETAATNSLQPRWIWRGASIKDHAEYKIRKPAASRRTALCLHLSQRQQQRQISVRLGRQRCRNAAGCALPCAARRAAAGPHLPCRPAAPSGNCQEETCLGCPCSEGIRHRIKTCHIIAKPDSMQAMSHICCARLKSHMLSPAPDV